jgi:hypothetical protein
MVMEVKMLGTVLLAAAFLSGFSCLWVMEAPRVVILPQNDEYQMSAPPCGPDRPILVRSYCRRHPTP